MTNHTLHLVNSINTCTQKNLHSHTYTHTQTHIHKHPYKYTHIHTHKHTKHTHKSIQNTHTETHTHTEYERERESYIPTKQIALFELIMKSIHDEQIQAFCAHISARIAKASPIFIQQTQAQTRTHTHLHTLT